MPQPSADLAAAARLLVQWAQVRQSAWCQRPRECVAKRAADVAVPSDLNREPAPSAYVSILARPAPITAASPGPTAVSLAPTSAKPASIATSAGPARAGVPRVNQPVRRLKGSQRRASRRGTTWTVRLAACAAGVLAIAAPAVWFAGRATTAPVSPAPLSGRVLFSSNPPGSSVFIDGVDSGKTPMKATLPAGSHTIEYRYRRNVRKIELSVLAGQDVSSTVDWTKKPLAPKRTRPAPRSPEPEASGVAPEASIQKPEALGSPEAISSKPEAESREPVHQ
jgi:PEGA domain